MRGGGFRGDLLGRSLGSSVGVWPFSWWQFLMEKKRHWARRMRVLHWDLAHRCCQLAFCTSRD